MLNLNDLNTQQKQAVLQKEGAVLVTAGAGSGKTRVLTYRIAHLISQGISPLNILAVTFTNKAANEMKERVSSLVANLEGLQVWVSTFHSMCVQILRQYNNIERLEGYNTNFSIYDQLDKERILKGLILENKIEEEGFLEKISWHISNAKNNNQTPKEYELEVLHTPSGETIIKIMQEYEDKLKSSNALDFDSLMTATYRLFVQNRDVLEYYQNKFKYIHIDEFQDTNKVQYQLVKLLSQKHKNVLVVGDEDQCIYTWRGANPKNIFEFSRDYAPVTIIKLEQNYRSSKNILQVANKVIANNSNRLEKKLWTDAGSGVGVEYKEAYNERAEAEYIAEHIYNLRQFNDYELKDIAVLVRLNALTRQIEERFLDYNLPYKVFGGVKFYDRLEIKNILAYLKLIVNPKDEASFNRVINFPKRGIGEAALSSLEQITKKEEGALNTVLELSYKSSNLPSGVENKFLAFKELMEDLIKTSKTLPISAFLQYTLSKTGIIEAYSSGKEEDESRLYNLNELVNSVIEFEKQNPDKTLEEYLNSVTLTTDIDTYDNTQDYVTLATVHSVKGLEFKVVFVIGCEENIFPLKRKDSDANTLEEERRLMYVAMTRAKERLYLTRSAQRFMYGETRYMLPSRFLKEAGLIEDKIQQKAPVLNTYTIENTTPAYDISTPQKIKVDVAEIVSKLKINDKVMHPKFGSGVVLSLSGEKDTRTATILFEVVGSKTLALNFAPLKIL